MRGDAGGGVKVQGFPYRQGKFTAVSSLCILTHSLPDTDTTMTNAAAVATEHAASMTAYLAELQAEREWAGRILTSTPYVIGWGNGIYIAVDDNQQVRGVGLLRGVTRFSREGAEKATAAANIQNGNGEAARPIGFIDALDAEIASTKATLTWLESFNG